MKNISLRSFAGISLLALGLVTSAVANPINGSISFNGTPNFDNSSLGSATKIISYDSAFVAYGQQTGDYASVPNSAPVTFNPFVFSPPNQTVSPLWSFVYDGRTYAGTVTSMLSTFNSDSNIWNLSGNMILSISGFEDTAATWNFGGGRIGDSYFFGSAAASNAPSVPDSGGTMLMLSLGLGMVMMSRSRLVQAAKSAHREFRPQLLG
jgi:hypothetical protein